MKRALLIAGAALVLACALLLGVNKTFFHSAYAIENEAGNPASIAVLPGSFFAGESPAGTAVFYRLGSREAMQGRIDQYVENLTSCYDDGAFCDTEQDFTIYSYQVEPGFLVHRIALVYKGIDLKEIENATGADLVTLAFGDEEVRLVQGDDYRAAQRESEQTSILNGTSKETAAVTGRGAALGDSLGEIMSAYGIAEAQGFWISRADGPPSLILAYAKEETQWNLLPAQDIGAVVPWLSGTTEDVPGEFLLIYRFDFESDSRGGEPALTGYRVIYL